jgi:outer membrane biosynthesis protein TonB
MSALALRSEERLGLGIAIAAHLALIAALVVTAASKPTRITLPPRMVVSLAKDVSLTSAAPAPAREAQAAIAETIAPEPKPPVERQLEAPKPKPVERPLEKPKPLPAKTRPVKHEAAPEKPKPLPKPQPKAQPKPAQKPAKSAGSLIGKNFLAGLGASTASEAKAPAAQMGPAEQASLQQAIARQLRPHWKPPSGADADQLVTILAFDLNQDGSLAGKPRVVSQSGIDASNKAQAGRHAELAIRAVELAAPFDLPPQYYSAWKRIKAWRFDWKSAQ